MERESGRLASPISLLAAVVLLAAVSCSQHPSEPSLPIGPVVIEGRLTRGVEGCAFVVNGESSWLVLDWGDSMPPMGATVRLLIMHEEEVATFCMSGMPVRLLRILDVRTDFRTAPVLADETWGPGDPPIVLGQVEVAPGATLTVLPGTRVRIIPEGALRVHGTLRMEGTAGDSIRVEGVKIPGPYGAAWPGQVLLEGAGSAVRYAVVPGLYVTGGDAVVEHARLRGAGAREAMLTLRDASVSYLSGTQATLVVERSRIDGAFAVHTELDLRDCDLGPLVLSYSRAAATGNRFGGAASRLVFHGASGGRFEGNRFAGDSLVIAVRHTSDPVFTGNDFVSPDLTVKCETYQRAECIRMENNWWGTTERAAIEAKIEAGCPVCFEPWLAGPATAGVRLAGR